MRHPPLKTASLIAAFAIALLYTPPVLAGCGSSLGSSAEQSDSPVDWPSLVKCGPTVPDLVSTVSRVLLEDGAAGDREITDRGKDALEDLAREHGPKTVACLVDELVTAWTSPGAAQQPDRAGAAARGEHFLQLVGTVVEERSSLPPRRESSRLAKLPDLDPSPSSPAPATPVPRAPWRPHALHGAFKVG